jgi:diacylglycerol kinase (ATP)
MPYLTASTRDLLRYKPVEYTVAADGVTAQLSALVLAFGNSRQWGFGAQIAPDADLADGLLDFVIVQDRGFVGNALRVPSLFLGHIHRRRGIQTRRVREVTISSREAMLFHIDGEAVQGTDTLVARVRPAGLRIQSGSGRNTSGGTVRTSMAMFRPL